MKLLLSTLALALLVPSVAGAGELATLKPTESMPLLGGRLSVDMPKGTTNTARQASIMAAAESEEDETRLMLDADDERLVVMTYELFATVPTDFEAAAEKFAQDGQSVEALELDSGLKAFAIVPSSHDTSREAIFLLGALIGHSDGTVQYVAVYVDPDGAVDIPGVTALARAIAASVEPGERTLETKARTVSMEGGKLSLALPDDTVFTTQEGPDFAVYRVEWLAELGEQGPSLGIYVGGHPSYQWSQQDIAEDAVTKTTGTFLGESVEWHAWTTAGGRALTEGVVDFPGDDYLKVHVFASGPDAAGRDLAQKVASATTAK